MDPWKGLGDTLTIVMFTQCLWTDFFFFFLRERARRISGGRAEQAEGKANAKALRWKHT